MVLTVQYRNMIIILKNFIIIKNYIFIYGFYYNGGPLFILGWSMGNLEEYNNTENLRI